MKLHSSINVLRALSLIISLAAIICHISQCYLLNSYQLKTGISDWITAGHWQYLIWYISLSLSLVGGLIVCLGGRFRKSNSFIIERYIGSLSFLLVLLAIIAVIASNSIEPWTNGKTEGSGSILLANCNLFDTSKDDTNAILYNRCLLSNSTHMSAVLLCIVWFSLSGLGIIASIRYRNSSIFGKNIIHPAVKEPVWGRYIPDPPSSIYTATIVDNRSGLLTPSSALTKEKHADFYSNCSSIYKERTYSLRSSPSSVLSETDYCSKGDYFGKSSDSYSKPSSVYYYGDNKSHSFYGGKNNDEGYESSITRDQPLLRVSTTFRLGSPSLSSDHESESATTMTGTPLYEKFSKSASSF